MYILTIYGKETDGAYSVVDAEGEEILYIFEDDDDAVRYAMMLEFDPEYEKKMEVVEVDDELAITTCKHYNYKYTVITPDDIVIPPKPK